MKKVKFRKGSSSVYNKWYSNNQNDDQTIFFTTDTHQIIIHGDYYGSQTSSGSIESIYWDDENYNIYYTISGTQDPISLDIPYVNLKGYGFLDNDTYEKLMQGLEDLKTLKKDYYGQDGTKQIVDETKNWIDVNN